MYTSNKQVIIIIIIIETHSFQPTKSKQWNEDNEDDNDDDDKVIASQSANIVETCPNSRLSN